jgi:3-hydroxy acid dehydrogenase/malonic semialdehyde reductase
MIVLVTGASAGIGAAIARAFVREGHRVIATARRQTRLDALHQELGDALLPLALDVCDDEAVAAFPHTLPAEFAAVDVLVNNAGLALGTAPAQKASLPDWDRMIDTNIRGLAHVTHAFLPAMVARNHGHIVNIASTAALYPYPGGNIYGGTKAFVKQFSLNLRADLAGTAVRVTIVEPGLCSGTEFSTVRYHGDEDLAENVYEGIEALTAEDIAHTVLWTTMMPKHVNVNTVELTPVAQSFGPYHIARHVNLNSK